MSHSENPTDSNLVAHAIRELDRIGETSLEEPSMRQSVLDIVRLFASQGHSGSSAAHCIAVLERLVRFEPLSPITDHAEDWVEVANSLWQCRRDPACFSKDGGKTYRRNGSDDLHVAVAA